MSTVWAENYDDLGGKYVTTNCNAYVARANIVTLPILPIYIWVSLYIKSKLLIFSKGSCKNEKIYLYVSITVISFGSPFKRL